MCCRFKYRIMSEDFVRISSIFVRLILSVSQYKTSSHAKRLEIVYVYSILAFFCDYKDLEYL